MNALATLGGGCFWCVEAALTQLEGVVAVISGYAGGITENPDYASVCRGDSGHVEVVQVEFDPSRLDFRTLLLAFFTAHDPTTLNRQGHDVGTQYRSVIFTHSAAQQAEALALIAELNGGGHWEQPIVTEVAPAPHFWPAETYHQDYFANNPNQPYCLAVVAPKVRKLRETFRDRLKRRS